MCYERRRAEACVDHGCCLLLQYLIHSCARGGRRIVCCLLVLNSVTSTPQRTVEDMCYEIQ
jgi:hypothetical protein